MLTSENLQINRSYMNIFLEFLQVKDWKKGSVRKSVKGSEIINVCFLGLFAYIITQSQNYTRHIKIFNNQNE